MEVKHNKIVIRSDCHGIFESDSKITAILP